MYPYFVDTMKLFAVILLVAFVACSLDAASHKRHKANVINEGHVDDGDSGDGNWPNPNAISNFDVPEDFNHPPNDGSDGQGHGEPNSGRHSKHHARKN